MRKSWFCRETHNEINSLNKQWHPCLNHTWSADKAYNNTTAVVNSALSSLHGGSLEITHTWSISDKQDLFENKNVNVLTLV